MVTIETTLGNIVLELFEKEAPETVANFLEYCKSGFYENTLFHRVIDGFMIQGGGLESGMNEKESKNSAIKNEADNQLKNERGTIAMARTNDPHSATSQFFINVVDNSFLNFRDKSVNGWGYCVFGKVIEGMDVVDRIKSVKTGQARYYQDVPVEEIMILKTVINE